MRQKKIKKNGGNFSNSVKMNLHIQKFSTKRAAPRGIYDEILIMRRDVLKWLEKKGKVHEGELCTSDSSSEKKKETRKQWIGLFKMCYMCQH